MSLVVMIHYHFIRVLIFFQVYVLCHKTGLTVEKTLQVIHGKK